MEAVPLKRGKIEAAIRSSANLEAEIEVSVFARTANRVKQLLVEEGDQVEKDQLLLKLEDYEQRIQAEQADARLEKIRRNFERTKALYEQQLVSEQVYADSQSELRQAELAAKQARLHLDYTEIRSPISGTVARRYVSVGDFVNTGMRLFDLVDFNSLAAPVYVPDKYLSELAVNQKARVRPTALPGQEFLGYVKRIAPVVEARSGTVKVTVGFHEPGPLRPGMYADVEIVTKVLTNALLIPKRALIYDQDQIFVFRVKKDLTAERVLVRPLITDRDNVAPEPGAFHEGDLVVVAGQSSLKDGAKVRFLNAEEGADSAEAGAAEIGSSTNAVSSTNAPSSTEASSSSVSSDPAGQGP